MATINTWSAAECAFTAGFFLLDQFGLCNSIYFIALRYGIVAIYLLIRLLGIFGKQSLGFSTSALCLLITAALVIANSKELPNVHLDFVEDK